MNVNSRVKRAVLSSESVARALRDVYPRYFKYHSLYLRYRSRYETWKEYGRHHRAEIDPLRLIWIDPTNVDQKIRDHDELSDRPYYVSEVSGGEWDRDEVESLREYDLYTSFEAHFADGLEWEETDFFQRVVGQLEDGKRKWGCTNREEFKRRCRRIDRLFDNIRKDGYKQQREILQENIDDPIDKNRRFCFAPSLGEVTVDIARDGTILFHTGRHRFSIARVLELDRIPVRVKIRHERWQRYRDRLVKEENFIRSDSHPDVVYLYQ